MTIRFETAEDIVDAFKGAGYAETSKEYVSPFNTAVFPPGYHDYRHGEYQRSWTLHRVEEVSGLSYIRTIVEIGQSRVNYVNVDIFPVGDDGIEIPSSRRIFIKNGRELTEKVFWLGNRTVYYIAKAGLVIMEIEKKERKTIVDNEIRNAFDQEVLQIISNLHKTMEQPFHYHPQGN